MNTSMNTWLRLAGGAALLGGAAIAVKQRVARVECEHPPVGRFITVDGVRLHYVEAGDGPPLVLLHGLGSMIEDLMLSGLIREAAKRYRVIAFDRPGYGRSERPRRFRYGPVAQAKLIHEACRALDARRPIVLGHSWGALVAVALALEHPGAARSLVLVSGLYFPSIRFDAPLMMPPALPLLGGVLARTLSPLAGRAMWPAQLRLLFGPAPVPRRFAQYFPAWMALRPAQLQAQAEDAAVTLFATLRFARRYRELKLPVVLAAGARDRFVSTRAHTERLHALLPASRLLLSPHAGHMVQHSDLPLVLDAVDAAAWPSAGSLATPA
jgi:pimeloyl-ACP methyl ester carboxylesterase